MRPTTEQTDELKKAYYANPHPTTEERQALSDRTGMYDLFSCILCICTMN